MISCATASADDQAIRERGEQIYRQACLKCHGEMGVGNEEFYPDPLVGDASIGELSKLIAETMPEEDPETCVAADAEAVALYIHHAFYSDAAQVRNRPPSIRLARLTAEQLRQSLAALYGAFDDPPWLEEKRGVKGVYYDGKNQSQKHQKIDRIDPVLNFDFGRESPGEGINANEFTIAWYGSLFVDATGRYEIIARSSCAFTMDFGHHDRELFNNHVQSEGRTEFRQTLNLTGGHAYPFEIKFYQRKRKTEQPPASFSLSWIAPGSIEEIIPHRNLIPEKSPPVFALQTKLPPDDRSYGYERGTAVSRQWDDSTTQAAIEFSQFAINELWPSYARRHRNDKNENRDQLRGFLSELVETAFRAPLTPQQRTRYVDQQVDQTPDDAEAIKRVCLIALKSPWFLYPTLDHEQPVSHRTANRLAFVLHDSLPSDRWLRDLVRKNKLTTDPELTQAAWRMVNDFRTQAKTRAFLYEWFDLAHADDLTKNNELFPGFDESIVADLRKSFDAFLHAVVWSETSDFRQLLQADWTFTNDRLARFYGDTWKPADDPANVDPPADVDPPEGVDPPADEKAEQDTRSDNNVLRRSVSDSKKRIGALNHPLLMADLAYHEQTSPIHRGVFLYRKILGRVLRPPNAAFSPLNPDLHPKLTTRQRVELQTDEVSCQVCHSKINPLGFALENFDPVGRFRESEKEITINATGSYITRLGQEVTFTGPRELADFLASSEDTHRAFVDSCFEHFAKQPINAYGPGTLDRLTKSFQDSGFNIRELLVAIAVTVASQARDTADSQS
ncbi:MAG: DUF1592 domain-containing protein [Pirellulaceae bacterium]|nr:DUF1592 domain-containing protein [Pirellulaceae bacterium]